MEYQHLTDRGHVLKRPGMYIGPVEQNKYLTWIFYKGKMEFRELKYSYGLIHIFGEILANAIDQSQRELNKKVSEIKVIISEDMISVRNNGDGIPIEKIKINEDNGRETSMYIPQMLFSKFKTSSNYNDTEIRLGAGTNGIGAKATAVFSKYFTVETIDEKKQLKYIQTFEDNLLKIGEPKITKYTGSPYTLITFKPDLEKFGLSKLNNIHKALIRKMVYDATALTNKSVRIIFDSEKLEQKTFEDYARLYLNSDIQLISESKRVVIKHGNISKESIWEYIVCESVEGFKQISFVNGIPTPEGGSHIDYIVNQIKKKFVARCNNKIREIDVKNNINIFLIAYIKNPVFASQTKEKLTTTPKNFGGVCEISDQFIEKLKKKTNLMESCLSLAKFQERQKLKQTNGTKRTFLDLDAKLVDAEKAGGKESHKCVLIITEGDSAKAGVLSGLSALGQNKKYFGVFPIRGKLINVRNTSTSKVSANNEIQNITKIIGLKHNVDYSDNIKSLRYGKIWIITDADVDGSHIKGLIVNFIEYYWASLLKRNDFLACMATPILKATRNREMVEFYSLSEYNQWLNQHQNEKWTVDYYKGLGTSEDVEFQKYFKDPKTIQFIWNNNSTESIKLAFEDKLADKRKDWLKVYDPDAVIDYSENKLSYTKLIDNDIKHFSIADNVRSIPNITDGLKPSLRKILFSAFEKKLENSQNIKVAQFGAYVAERTEYHHGEASLHQAIIGMAQDFVGSNNINLLYPKGQFGSRVEGGKDHAAPRYIFTRLNNNTPKIFDKRDFGLYKYLVEDGNKIEPMYYVPILPMILINGTSGIGTGYSTFIPCFNPLDIINNIKRLNNNQELIDMKPWYNNFKGLIIENEKKTGYITKGVYKCLSNYEVQITELPIGVWTTKYLEYLKRLALEKRKVKKLNIETNIIKNELLNRSDKLNVDITIKFVKPWNEMFDNISEVENILGLTSKVSLTNMYLFNENNEITKYNTPEDILVSWYNIRKRYYIKRKEHLLNKLKENLKFISEKIRFIQLVINRELIIEKKKKVVLEEELRKLEFIKISESYDYLLNLPLWSLTEERIVSLEKQAQKNKDESEELNKLSANDLWNNDLDSLSF